MIDLKIVNPENETWQAVGVCSLLVPLDDVESLAGAISYSVVDIDDDGDALRAVRDVSLGAVGRISAMGKI